MAEDTHAKTLALDVLSAAEAANRLAVEILAHLQSSGGGKAGEQRLFSASDGLYGLKGCWFWTAEERSAMFSPAALFGHGRARALILASTRLLRALLPGAAGASTYLLRSFIDLRPGTAEWEAEFDRMAAWIQDPVGSMLILGSDAGFSHHETLERMAGWDAGAGCPEVAP